MYLVANVALVVEWVKFRRRGIHKNVWLWVVTPVIGVIVLAIPIWGDLRPGQPSPYNALPWLTIGLIAVGVDLRPGAGRAAGRRCSSGRRPCSRARKASPPTRCSPAAERAPEQGEHRAASRLTPATSGGLPGPPG